MTKAEKLEIFHRTNIANAAEKLFVENGIDKTSMDQIAREADYSKSTIYVYFKNKEEIILYLVLEGMNQIYDSIEAIVDDDSKLDIKARYCKICHVLTALYEKSPFIFSKMLESIEMKEAERKKVPLLDDIYLVGERINNKLGEFLEGGKRDKKLDVKGDAKKVSFMFWIMLSGVIQYSNNKSQYIQTQFKQSTESFMDEIFEMMFKIVAK